MIPLSAWLMALAATPLWAHPGHGSTSPESAVHYVVEPAHGWWILVLFAITAAAVLLVRYRTSQRRLQTDALRKRESDRQQN